MTNIWKLPPVMPAAFAAVGIIVHLSIWDARILPEGINWMAGGLALLAAVALFAWALQSLRRRGESPMVHEAPQQVVIDGAYEWGRNPIYVAFLLFIASVGLLVNGWAILLAVLPAFAWLNFYVVAREERSLATGLAPEYDIYRQRTHRWV